MTEIKVKEGQNLIDVCVQYYGDTSQLDKLIEDNFGLTINSDLFGGQVLLIDESFSSETVSALNLLGYQIGGGLGVDFESNTLGVKLVKLIHETVYSKGQIEIEVNGGTKPYYINWSNGKKQTSITSLDAGIYSVVVTDDVGRVDSIEVEVLKRTVPVYLIDDNGAPLLFEGEKLILNYK